MNTFPVLLAALCVYALGIVFTVAFIAAKVLALDDRRVTPSRPCGEGTKWPATSGQ